jgi:hypothetical protein
MQHSLGCSYEEMSEGFERQIPRWWSDEGDGADVAGDTDNIASLNARESSPCRFQANGVEDNVIDVVEVGEPPMKEAQVLKDVWEVALTLVDEYLVHKNDLGIQRHLQYLSPSTASAIIELRISAGRSVSRWLPEIVILCLVETGTEPR